MGKIILIRHGQTNTNIKGLIHRVGDSEVLNDEGFQQILGVVDKIKHLKPSKVYTSNEKRTFQSGEIIAQAFKIPIESVSEIKERDWGDFVGRMWPEVEAILSPMSLEERYLYQPPKGESWKTFETRLIKVIDAIIKENPNENVVVMTHGGVIRALMPYILNLPKQESFKYNPENAFVEVFEHHNGKFTSYEV